MPISRNVETFQSSDAYELVVYRVAGFPLRHIVPVTRSPSLGLLARLTRQTLPPKR
jgi:hypothetical protein